MKTLEPRRFQRRPPEVSEFMRGDPPVVVSTKAGESCSKSDMDAARNDLEWLNIIEDKLNQWKHRPAEFEDEEYPPISKSAVTRAIQTANMMRSDGLPAPTHVALGADGGVVFELVEEKDKTKFKFTKDGGIHIIVFNGDDLVAYETVFLP